MEREQRFRFVGFLFFLAALSLLLLTTEGIALAGYLLRCSDSDGLVAGVAGVAVAFFSSEAVGYVFSSVIQFAWNVTGGYSGLWDRKLSHDLRVQMRDRYRKHCQMAGVTGETDTLTRLSCDYTTDVLVSYFWQQTNESVIGWATRRASAFFTGWSAVLAMFLGILCSAIIICHQGLHATPPLYGLGLFWLLVMSFLAFNAQHAKKELWQVVDLWQSRAFDVGLDGVLRDLEAQLSGPAASQGRPECASRVSPRRK